MLSLLLSVFTTIHFFFVLYIFLRFMNGLMFIFRLCPFHERIFITNSSSFRNQKIVARILETLRIAYLGNLMLNGRLVHNFIVGIPNAMGG